jgi:IrrE N-terminal-like domain
MLNQQQLTKVMKLTCRRIKDVHFIGHPYFLGTVSCWNAATREIYLDPDDLNEAGLFVVFHELTHAALNHRGNIEAQEVEANYVAAFVCDVFRVPYAHVRLPKEFMNFSGINPKRAAKLLRLAKRVVSNIVKVLTKQCNLRIVQSHVEAVIERSVSTL